MRILIGPGALFAALFAVDGAQAAPAAAVDFICRGTRTVFANGDAREFKWVEQRWQVDFANDEVRDADGRRLEAEITRDLIVFEYEIDSWSRPIVRQVRIDRAEGAFLERAGDGGSTRDRTEGVCLRLGG